MSNIIRSVMNALRGGLAGFLLLLNLIALPLLILLSAFCMLIFPLTPWRKHFIWFQQVYLPPYWADINNWILSVITPIQWEVHGKGELHLNDWYFLICNHQSWADILVLDKLFNRKIPKIKFFMKQELLWLLPICGLACKVMGYPFIKRHRDRKGLMQDIEATKKISQSLKIRPTSLANFLEGTRFTPKKQKEIKNSPYQHLLTPNPLMLALVTESLTGYLNNLINVTIIYSKAPRSFWFFLSGGIQKITVYYEVIPIDARLRGDYLRDKPFRKRIQECIQQLWLEKDQLLR